MAAIETSYIHLYGEKMCPARHWQYLATLADFNKHENNNNYITFFMLIKGHNTDDVNQ